jgi:hypothetical protein
LFLFACMLLRGLLRTLSEGAVLEILDEGLLIIGWVAMWRPLENLPLRLDTDQPPLSRFRQAVEHAGSRPVEVKS